MENTSNKRSIRQTNALIRALVEQETVDHPFWISGVVVRHFLSNRGHVYFNLVDGDSSISCIVRERVRGTLETTITSGMELEVYGAVSVYEREARVQIDVEKIHVVERPKYVIDNATIEQLTAKGLWPKVKHPIPAVINKIGLITSKQSEALHDFEDQYREDGGTAAIKLADVRLQGEQAVREIAGAIDRLNQVLESDVIVLIRGGGRAAELAVFNNLLIAEAICRSTLPIVTGIGHQRDESLADQLADYATITPTAAASYLARETQAKQAATMGKSKAMPQWAVYLIGVLIIFIAILIALLILGRG